MALERVDHADWVLNLGREIIRARSSFSASTGRMPNTIYFSSRFLDAVTINGKPRFDVLYGMKVRILMEQYFPKDFRLGLEDR